MNKDGRFDILQVSNTLIANDIQANSITLRDTVLKGNIHTSGKRVKELYENQKNTNCFEDAHKDLVIHLDKNITQSKDNVMFKKPIFQPLIMHNLIKDENIPNDSYCICLDDEYNPIYKMKINDVIKYTPLTAYEPKIRICINNNDTTSMTIET